MFALEEWTFITSADKTDLRTDLSTLMELSHQKQAPISYEQVCVCMCVCVCVLEVQWGRLQERA